VSDARFSPDAVAADVGLDRARFDQVVRHLCSMGRLLDDLEVDETVATIAAATGTTSEQVRYVLAAWLRP
jgi:hypothetical protein